MDLDVPNKRVFPVPPVLGVKRKVETFKFDAEDKAKSDICLIVKGRKFYCSKQQLCEHTDFFMPMFYNNNFSEAGREELELKEIEEPEDFLVFLKLINGINCLKDTDEETVLRVLQLSNYWMASLPMALCIDFLKDHSSIPRRDLLNLAMMYNINPLKIKIISEVKTTIDLAILIPSDPTTLEKETKNLMFLKSLELNGIHMRPSKTYTAHMPRNLKRQIQQNQAAVGARLNVSPRQERAVAPPPVVPEIPAPVPEYRPHAPLDNDLDSQVRNELQFRYDFFERYMRERAGNQNGAQNGAGNVQHELGDHLPEFQFIQPAAEYFRRANAPVAPQEEPIRGGRIARVQRGRGQNRGGRGVNRARGRARNRAARAQR